SAMGALTVILVGAVAWAVTRLRPVAVLTALAAALTPGFLLASGTVDNDNGAILVSTAALLVLMQSVARERAWRWFALFGLLAGLALLTKTNTYFLVALGLVAAGLLFVRERLQGQSGATQRLVVN